MSNHSPAAAQYDEYGQFAPVSAAMAAKMRAVSLSAGIYRVR